MLSASAREPTRRIACLGAALGACVVLAGLVVAACYDVPQPVCGFRCGPAAVCPDDYTCDPADGRCHLNGAAPMVCGTIDAGPPVDTPDAPDAPDAPGELFDAIADAPVDAPMIDAPDAMVDAPDAI